jgi:thymidylate kinase
MTQCAAKRPAAKCLALLRDAEVKHRSLATFSGNPAAVKCAVDPLDCDKLPNFLELCSERGWAPVKLSELFLDVFRCDFAIEAGASFFSFEFCWDLGDRRVRAAASRQIRKWCCSQGVNIALLGPDGVGKSTFAWELAQALRPVFSEHRIFQWRPQVLKPRPGTPPGVFNVPHSDPVHGALESVARLAAVMLDYWTAEYLTIKPLLGRSGVVIWDRSFHDLMVDYRRYRYGGPMSVARAAMRLLPGREWVFLILEAGEDVIFSRKQEVEVEELRRQCAEYHRLAQELPNAHIIRTDHSMEDAVAEGVGATASYLTTRLLSRCRPACRATIRTAQGMEGAVAEGLSATVADLAPRDPSR